MAKYKIVRLPSISNAALDRFFVYRKTFLFWQRCNSEWSQKEAEEWIARDKKIRELRKKKPEVVGYY